MHNLIFVVDVKGLNLQLSYFGTSDQALTLNIHISTSGYSKCWGKKGHADIFIMDSSIGGLLQAGQTRSK